MARERCAATRHFSEKKRACGICAMKRFPQWSQGRWTNGDFRSETFGEGEEQRSLRSEVLKALESIKWYLWHGNVFQPLRHLQFVEMDLEGQHSRTMSRPRASCSKRLRNSARNRGFIPNYGERYRDGERISTGFVESAVNQVISKRFVKKQQMRWTPRGAHLLLQTRTKVLNGDLEDTFRRWYPAFRSKTEAKAA